jgi:ribonucleoside-triphosphate reductase
MDAKELKTLYTEAKKQLEEKKSYHLNYGVYFTPAENLCYTAMTKFKKKYGNIKDVSTRSYFTNSMHIPVWEDIDVFDKIEKEAELTAYSNAGCITYIELDSGAKNNIEAVADIISKAMKQNNHSIPYFAINVPNDTCNSCGYTDEINDVCPMCGSTSISRLRRVTGYLTGNYTTAFNDGKQEEVRDRKKHKTFKNN